MDFDKNFLKKHLGIMVGAGAGVLVGVLFLTIGFFQTLLLLILGGIGAAIGALSAVREAMASWFMRIIEKIIK